MLTKEKIEKTKEVLTFYYETNTGEIAEAIGTALRVFGEWENFQNEVKLYKDRIPQVAQLQIGWAKQEAEIKFVRDTNKMAGEEILRLEANLKDLNKENSEKDKTIVDLYAAVKERDEELLKLREALEKITHPCIDANSIDYWYKEAIAKADIAKSALNRKE